MAPLGGTEIHAIDCTEVKLYHKQTYHNSDRHSEGDGAGAQARAPKGIILREAK